MAGDDSDQVCAQSSCDRPATHRMFWPGRPPSPICAECIPTAKNIADAMGFYLHIEEKPADD